MRKLTFLPLLLLAVASPALAFKVSGVITGDTSGEVEQSVLLQWGCGTVRLSKTGDGSGNDDNFGTGTVTVKELLDDDTWGTIEDFSSAPDPIPRRYDFAGEPTTIGVHMGSSSSPDLYWQITSENCGSR